MIPEHQTLLKALIAQGSLDPVMLEARKDNFFAAIREKGITRGLMSVFSISENVIADTISASFKCARRAITNEIETAPGQLLSDEEIKTFRAIPVFRIGIELTMAFIDPPIKAVVIQIQKLTGCSVLAIVTTPSDFDTAFNKYQGSIDKLQNMVSTIKLEKFDLQKGGATESRRLVDGTSEATMAQLVDELFLRATKMGASDIHIEPLEKELLIRFRIDGVLQRILTLPKEAHPALVAVVKSKCGMDMFERAIPQDGRITIDFADRSFDVRVSSLPLIEGEKIVLRILSKSSGMIELENLGFSEENLKLFRSLMRLPNGIILVTGPTGSGKTTTLYAALNEIKGITKNITTVENPVEYKLPLVNQVQIVPERGLTFATSLRSILRQDPNIILIGEIRDAETGIIATEAALTGHLVLSTIHTNDAFGAISRLINLGIASFWVSASVIGVQAQRLVRRICIRCKEEYEPSREFLRTMGLSGLPEGITFFRGKGCNFCTGIGYKGRLAIHEVFMITEAMREIIYGEVTTRKLRDLAVANNFHDMYFDGIQKALAGLTSIEEIQRVTRRIM
ncbi:MAG: GspE/PulE family protein [Bacteroidota bacterium]